MKKSMFLSVVVALALIPGVAMAGMSVMTAEELEAIDGQAQLEIIFPAVANIVADISGVSYSDSTGIAVTAPEVGWMNIDGETTAGDPMVLGTVTTLNDETITINVGTTTGGVSIAEIGISGVGIAVTPPDELVIGIDSSTVRENTVGSISLATASVTITGALLIRITAN